MRCDGTTRVWLQVQKHGRSDAPPSLPRRSGRGRIYACGDWNRCETVSPRYCSCKFCRRNRKPRGLTPRRFTIHDLNPDLGIEILQETLSGSDIGAGSSHPEVLQSLSLATVINPLVQAEMINLTGIDQIKIVLDAEVWQNPAARIESVRDDVDNIPESMEFETRDSAQTPGLQLADIAAYTWGRQLRFGDCRSGVSQLNELRITSQ